MIIAIIMINKTNNYLLFQGGCEGSKVVLFFSFAWVSHMEREH
jgi:hypothetical protein